MLKRRQSIQSRIDQNMAKRHRKEKRFQIYGIIAIAISFIFLVFLLFSILSKGYGAFIQTKISIPITFTEDIVDPSGSRDISKISKANYTKLLHQGLRQVFPDAKTRKQKRQLYALMSKTAPLEIRDALLDDLSLIGKTKELWLPASSLVDMFFKQKISLSTPERQRPIKNQQIDWLLQLHQYHSIKKSFNLYFFTSGDSREPEIAGVMGSMIGSFFIVLVCMLVAFPLGILSAIYLEEFAPKNRLTDFIEVNINNLAAVPSIVFGLLGLSVYIHWMDLPRSASLVGGLTLALMALPVIVITTRTSIRSIPQSIRDGALALGATRMQTTLHHVLPLAMPGIMTGSILSIARVLGETAPLLMIGMVAFVVDIPSGIFDAATALPVQIYLWADSPEIGFVEKTSAAIIVLLVFLAIINVIAAGIRRQFETKW